MEKTPKKTPLKCPLCGEIIPEVYVEDLEEDDIIECPYCGAEFYVVDAKLPILAKLPSAHEILTGEPDEYQEEDI